MSSAQKAESTATVDGTPMDGPTARRVNRHVQGYSTEPAEPEALEASEATEPRARPAAPERPLQELKFIRYRGLVGRDAGQTEIHFVIDGYLSVTDFADATHDSFLESMKRSANESDELRELRRQHETSCGYRRRVAELTGELERTEAKLIDAIRSGADLSELEKRVGAIPDEVRSLERRIELLKEPIHEAQLKATAFVQRAFTASRQRALAEAQQAYEQLFNELCSNGTLPALIVAYARWHNVLNAHGGEAQFIRDAMRDVPAVPSTDDTLADFPGYGSYMYPPQDPDDVRRREAASDDAATHATLARLKQRELQGEEYNAMLAAQHKSK